MFQYLCRTCNHIFCNSDGCLSYPCEKCGCEAKRIN